MNETQFGDFYSTNYEKLLSRICKKATLEVAEDIVADVFVALWEISTSGDILPENPYDWLCVKAHDKLKDYYKHESIASEINEDLTRASAAPSMDSLVSAQQIPTAELAGVVSDERLSAAQKQFVSSLAQGLSISETAKLLSISRKAADNRLARIRAILNN